MADQFPNSSFLPSDPLNDGSHSGEWFEKIDAFFCPRFELPDDRPSLEIEDRLRALAMAGDAVSFWVMLHAEQKGLHAARSGLITEWFDCEPVASLVYPILVAAGPEFVAAVDEQASGTKPVGSFAMARAQLHIRNREFEPALAELARALKYRRLDPKIAQLELRCRRAMAGGDFLANPYNGLLCHFPFEEVFLQAGGDLVPCCSTGYMPYPVGNAFRDDLRTVWNGRRAREIRSSILDGSYRYCNPKACHLMATGTLYKRDQIEAQGPDAVAARFPMDGHSYPEALGLLHDSSCNLTCEMCRDGLIMASGDEVRTFRRIEPMLLEWIHKSRSLHLSGSGEPLASRHFRNLLAAMNRPPWRLRPDFVLRFLTHGLMFDQEFWERHDNLHGVRIVLLLSIDGADQRSYETIRKGGSFEVLQRNLAFIAGLRASGAIAEVRLQFAVQAENVDQLVPFVRMMADHGFDKVHFLPLQKRRHYGDARFVADNVCDPAHPRHAELLAQLNDPVMDHEIVARGNSVWAIRGVRARGQQLSAS